MVTVGLLETGACPICTKCAYCFRFISLRYEMNWIQKCAVKLSEQLGYKPCKLIRRNLAAKFKDISVKTLLRLKTEFVLESIFFQLRDRAYENSWHSAWRYDCL